MNYLLEALSKKLEGDIAIAHANIKAYERNVGHRNKLYGTRNLFKGVKKRIQIKSIVLKITYFLIEM